MVTSAFLHGDAMHLFGNMVFLVVIGLLVLGPIIVNILAFHAFVTAGQGLFGGMILTIVGLALYLLWVERRAFSTLVTRKPA